MKTLEKVARAIRDASMCEKSSWEYIAQAAIDALDIIILPKDAEPEEGDIGVNPNGYTFTCETERCTWYEVGYAGEATDKNIKIIQRNGKPVIQEQGDAKSKDE